MSDVLVNPGTGPVPDATLAQATANLEVFLADVRATLGWKARLLTASKCPTDAGDGDGRFDFRIALGKRSVRVAMPGIATDIVRGSAETGRSCMDGPRLYVDGNSWWWPFAIDVVRAALIGSRE